MELLLATGGYFVTYYASKPVARRIVELCKGAGLLLTLLVQLFPMGTIQMMLSYGLLQPI